MPGRHGSRKDTVGLMKTDVIRIDSGGGGMAEALEQVEKFAVYEGLDKKETLQLRLLAEEMMGMFRGIAGEFEAEFYGEGQNGTMRLCIESRIMVDREQRKELLALSKTGKNTVSRGFMGKVRDVFENFMLHYDEVQHYGVMTDDSFIPFQSMGMINGQMIGSTDSVPLWSLEAYRNGVGEEEEPAEAWDELEKSIVATIADDVQIGVRDGYVRIVILKEF